MGYILKSIGSVCHIFKTHSLRYIIRNRSSKKTWIGCELVSEGWYGKRLIEFNGFFASIFTDHNSKVWGQVWQSTAENKKLELLKEIWHMKTYRRALKAGCCAFKTTVYDLQNWRRTMGENNRVEPGTHSPGQPQNSHRQGHEASLLRNCSQIHEGQLGSIMNVQNRFAKGRLFLYIRRKQCRRTWLQEDFWCWLLQYSH